jgi:hypothetical protein
MDQAEVPPPTLPKPRTFQPGYDPRREKSPRKPGAAFEALVESVRPLVVANAPAQSRDAPSEDAARVLSLDGRWRDGRVERRGEWLALLSRLKNFFEPGMSGSPIIDEAIGVVSVDQRSPVLVDSKLAPPRRV